MLFAIIAVSKILNRLGLIVWCLLIVNQMMQG